jgi:adenylate cyclase
MNTENFKRRLTAILSADVEGYIRLMRDDEDETIRTIPAYRTAIAKLVEQYRGRVVVSPGDNILSEFGSSVDAVDCAVEVQRELTERNAELPEDRRMQFRMGVNSGDIVQEGERIYGDGVNIAARIEGLTILFLLSRSKSSVQW